MNHLWFTLTLIGTDRPQSAISIRQSSIVNQGQLFDQKLQFLSGAPHPLTEAPAPPARMPVFFSVAQDDWKPRRGGRLDPGGAGRSEREYN